MPGESSENLHLSGQEDARGSRAGAAFRRLFFFSSNFLGGAERKVALKGISTFYRSAYLAPESGISLPSAICAAKLCESTC